MLPARMIVDRQGRARLLCLAVSCLPVLMLFSPHAFRAQTSSSQEISSKDVQPTFKLQAERNLVMVRVVVRDGKGATIDNLRKEDFQLFDKGKAQTILNFSIQKPVHV